VCIKIIGYLNRVGEVSDISIRLDNSGVDSISVSLKNKGNFVDTALDGGGATSQQVLTRSGRNGQQEVDGVVVLKRNRLTNDGARDISVKTSRVTSSNLAHQFAANIRRGGVAVGQVLLAGSISASHGNTADIIDSSESRVKTSLHISTLGGDVSKKSRLVIKQINTMNSVKQLVGKVANKVVLKKVLVVIIRAEVREIRRTAGTRVHHSMSGVDTSGPASNRHIVLDISSINIIDISGIGLEVEHILQITSLQVENSSRRGINSYKRGLKSTREIAKERTVQSGKNEVNSGHYSFFILLCKKIRFLIAPLCIFPKTKRANNQAFLVYIPLRTLIKDCELKRERIVIINKVYYLSISV